MKVILKREDELARLLHEGIARWFGEKAAPARA